MTGKELYYIAQAHFHGKLAGDGPFTKKCHSWIQKNAEVQRALLAHSCTASLEMAALLLDIQPGDEIIMPSYTFVSTANAFVLRGGVPVFVDIREDTLNIDEDLIEPAITKKTRAIVVVHYAGISCNMDRVLAIAQKHHLPLVEDAAQALMARYKNKPLGSIGDLGTYSFHETKNVISGEGGALCVNRDDLVLQAEIIREKGTNRSQFFRGETDKYTWQSMGSSFLPGEVVAAFLWAQLEEAKEITAKRLSSWNYYHALLHTLEKEGTLMRPTIPKHCQHNAHMYYILLPEKRRQRVLEKLNNTGIHAVFHYIPLHTSPAGEKYGRANGELPVTVKKSRQIIRLPFWTGISEQQQEYIMDKLKKTLSSS